MICPFLKGHKIQVQELYLADFFFNLAGPSLIGSIIHDKSWLKEIKKKYNNICTQTTLVASNTSSCVTINRSRVLVFIIVVPGFQRCVAR